LIRHPSSGKGADSRPEKILNRGNEPKDLLKTKGLALLGAENEPKTNPILNALSANQTEKAPTFLQENGQQ
jgi:hypothetical protein